MSKKLSRAELQELLAEQRMRVTDLEEDNALLREAAIYDALTGLHSRALLNRELAKHWASSCYDAIHDGPRAASLSRPFAVLLVDIDHFKRVNDNHGHDVGDEMLKRVSKVLQETSRESDVVGRWGGEEFLIILPDTAQTQAEHLASRLRVVIESAKIGQSVLDGPLTVSIGASGAGPYNPAKSPDEVVKRADVALYHAKENGRNCVERSFIEMVA